MYRVIEFIIDHRKLISRFLLAILGIIVAILISNPAGDWMYDIDRSPAARARLLHLLASAWPSVLLICFGVTIFLGSSFLDRQRKQKPFRQVSLNGLIIIDTRVCVGLMVIVACLAVALGLRATTTTISSLASGPIFTSTPISAQRSSTSTPNPPASATAPLATATTTLTIEPTVAHVAHVAHRPATALPTPTSTALPTTPRSAPSSTPTAIPLPVATPAIVSNKDGVLTETFTGESLVAIGATTDQNPFQGSDISADKLSEEYDDRGWTPVTPQSCPGLRHGYWGSDLTKPYAFRLDFWLPQAVNYDGSEVVYSVVTETGMFDPEPIRVNGQQIAVITQDQQAGTSTAAIEAQNQQPILHSGRNTLVIIAPPSQSCSAIAVTLKIRITRQ